MTKFCRLLRWVCSFLIAAAIAQMITPLPWSTPIVLLVASVFYIFAKQQQDQSDNLHFQIIACGLVLGWMKCFLNG